MVDRLSRDEYYMGIARAAALRSTCPKQRVGAVAIGRGGELTTGYNGAPPNVSHCVDRPEGICQEDKEGHCLWVIHAELNAILKAQLPETLYTTHLPCLECTKVILRVGINRVVWESRYKDPRIGLRMTTLLMSKDVEVDQLNG